MRVPLSGRLASRETALNETGEAVQQPHRCGGVEKEVSQLWVIEKEPEHLPRGVRSLRIRVRPGGTATRPGVARSMNEPLLEDYLSARVMMLDPAVAAATRYSTFLNRCLQVDVQRFPELRDDVIAVMRMHRRILISMENNRRDDARTPASANPAPCRALVLAHCRERGSNVAGRSAGQAGMHANCGVEVGVGCRQNGRGRGAG